MPGRFEDDDRDDPPDRRAASNTAILIGLLVAGALAVVVVCGGGLAYLFMARGAAREAAARAEAADAAAARDRGPAGEAGDGAQLLAEFRVDPAGAARRRADQRVRVTAAITQVDPNEGDPYVMLAGPIMVLPAPAESKKFGALKAGAVVTVEGTVVPPAGAAPLMLSAATLVPPGQ